jgi:hypothetical protein
MAAHGFTPLTSFTKRFIKIIMVDDLDRCMIAAAFATSFMSFTDALKPTGFFLSSGFIFSPCALP